MDNVSFREIKEALLSEFRDSLQGESRYIERSFINYLDTEAKKHGITKDDSKVNERTKAKIERMASKIIGLSDAEKQNLLGDKALEELMDISDFAFSLARQTFYKEDYLFGPRKVDIRGLADRMLELRKKVKPHNKDFAWYETGEASWDLEMIGNPLSNLMSHRIAKLYDQKGTQFVSLRKRFYAKMKRTTRSLRWKMLSNEEAIQKSFELYYQMREDELGIKPDRENSVGLNYVKLSRASG